MPREQALRRLQDDHPPRSGIGIHAVEAASLCCKEKQKVRTPQDQIEKILPYEETDRCTD